MDRQPARPDGDSSAAPRDEDALLAPFATRLPPVRTPLKYRIALAFVAVVMILLPVIYIAFVAATAAGVTWHAIANRTIFESQDSRGAEQLVFYALPIFVGTIGLIFLIKPLIAPRRKTPPPFALDAEDHPFLFRFVEHLSDSVGAPRPVRIDVDLRANASASLRRGFRSFVGQDLVLTIGLPLVSELTVRQLAGVFAHELGHFTQGGGMRLGYLVHRIQLWFARVVYERDVWDERLLRWREQDGGLGSWIVFGSAQGFVFLSRKLLWVLMRIGLLFGAFLSRQMEYDADRYEARLAGSEAFEQTVVALARLSLAEHWAMSDLSQAARGQKLVDDLPQLILSNLTLIDAKPGLAEKLEADARGGVHHFSSTHPTNGDRIAAVRRENAAGIFTIEEPGTILFDDFPALCRAATRHHYTHNVEIDLSAYEVLAADVLAVGMQARNSRVEQVVEHFAGVYPAPCQVFVARAPDLEAARVARARIASLAASAGKRQALLGERIDQWEQTLGSLAVVRIDQKSGAMVTEFENTRDALAAEIESLTSRLEPWRLAGEASLFYGEQTEEEIASRGDRVLCRAALVGLRKIWEDRRTLSARLTEFLFLLENEPANRDLLMRRRHSTACRVYELLGSIHTTLEGIPHPFPSDENPGATLVSDLLPSVPEVKDASDLIVASQRLLERSGALSVECLAPFVQAGVPA